MVAGGTCCAIAKIWRPSVVSRPGDMVMRFSISS